MNSVVLNESLSQTSLLVVFTAMLVFTAAFLISGWHLSKAASNKVKEVQSS
jgi:hypothetical protein